MDHAVHINGGDNGSRAAKPIILRLLPGEETIFNLRVVNHGEPSNISLLASSTVLKAVRLNKSDHYVVMEEIIPVMARMPAGKRRLDGEIVLSSPAGKSRVPITLLRDSEDPGDDLEAPGPAVDADLSDGGPEGDGEDGEEGEEDGPDYEEAQDDADDADDDEHDYGDGPDGPPRRKRSGQDDDGDGEDEGSEPRRITFSRDQDLQRYRSASRRRKGAEKPRPEDERAEGDRAISRTPPRFVTRIDDSFVDKSTLNPEGRASQGARDRGAGRGLDGGAGGPRPGRIDPIDAGKETENQAENETEYGPESETENEIPGYRRDGDRESRERFDSAEREDLAAGFQDNPRQQEGFGQDADGSRLEDASAVEREGQSEYDSKYNGGYDDGYEDEGERGSLLERLDGLSLGSTQIIPAVIFLALVAALVLTFIMEAIPEFAGALASSILIVTLIIYGAATLLKA